MAPSHDHEALSQLQTEARSSWAPSIDLLDTLGLCKAFNREEAHVTPAVTGCLPTVSLLIDELVPRLRAGGRLIYVGAGNSGRVAFMDCSELPVTFSADPNQFLTVVAGGMNAIIQAEEGAEDCESDGVAQLEAINPTPKDTVIGISASGRTPFVLGALKVARKNKALTAGITNADPSSIARLGVNHLIVALVGPEFLTGSTRLKAGSSAKRILQMISTCSMIRLGKSYKGLMIDVRVKNNKLKARGRRIIRQVSDGASMYILGDDGRPSAQAIDIPETPQGNAVLDSLIEQCRGSVKLACAVAFSGLSPSAAQHLLDLAGDKFHIFVKGLASQASHGKPNLPGGLEYFLAIDGGGTNCTVSIATASRVVARATAGACNFNCVTIDELLEQVKSATLQAAALIPEEHRRHFKGIPNFTKVWAGFAGLHHAYETEILAHHLEQAFNVSLQDGSMRLTSDGMLLSSCISIDDSVEGGIVVIAGTGAVAIAFKRTSNGEVVQAGRTGGWGHLVGDHGSAFDIGKRALQTVLTSLEQSQGDDTYQLTELEAGILARLNCSKEDLLSTILRPSGQSKQQIGDLAKVVTELGFRADRPDRQAWAILQSAAGCLVQLIRPLSKKQICEPSKSSLVLSGALMNLSAYRDLILDEWAGENLDPFKKVVVVNDASSCAVQFLANQAAAAEREPTKTAQESKTAKKVEDSLSGR